MKDFADDNFKFDENGRKLSKPVENTVEKTEIACYKQFLLFPQCFQKACLPGASKGVIVWEWVNLLTSDNIIFMDWSNLKAFANNKNVTENLKFLWGEGLLEKEKMLVNSIFSFFNKVFKRLCFFFL